MDTPSNKGPIRLTKRAGIGNGLWWLAKRRMSSWRLARNHEAIQIQISRIQKNRLPRTFATTLSVALLFGGLAWGAGWQLNKIYQAPVQGLGPQATLVPEIIAKASLNIIVEPIEKLPSAPLNPINTRQVINQKTPQTSTRQQTKQRHNQNPLKPTKLLSPAPQVNLSRMIKQFNIAKQEHEDGDLENAMKLFLRIARQHSHPTLGPESYLRAIAIARAKGDESESILLLKEALAHWPNLNRSKTINR